MMMYEYYEYYEPELKDCIVDSFISLGFKDQAELIRNSFLTPDLINKLIDTIKSESIKRDKDLDERLHFMGLSYE